MMPFDWYFRNLPFILCLCEFPPSSKASKMADKKKKSGLTEEQKGLIEALLVMDSKRDAAQVQGIPERTMYNWLREPEFRDAYRAALLEVFMEGMSIFDKRFAK